MSLKGYKDELKIRIGWKSKKHCYSQNFSHALPGKGLKRKKHRTSGQGTSDTVESVVNIVKGD